MEKKIYTAPSIMVVTITAKGHMLDNTSIAFSKSEYSGGPHRSREAAVWDDEDEY